MQRKLMHSLLAKKINSTKSEFDAAMKICPEVFSKIKQASDLFKSGQPLPTHLKPKKAPTPPHVLRMDSPPPPLASSEGIGTSAGFHENGMPKTLSFAESCAPTETPPSVTRKGHREYFLKNNLNTCGNLPESMHEHIARLDRRRQYYELFVVRKVSTTLLRKVAQEVRRAPWISLYGKLPVSPRALFVQEQKKKGDYKEDYLRRIWATMTPAARAPYLQAFEVIQNKKYEVKKLIKNTQIQGYEVYIATNMRAAMQRPENMRLDKRAIVIGLKKRFDALPPQHKTRYEKIAEEKRLEARMNFDELVRRRMEQIQQLQIMKSGGYQHTSKTNCTGSDEE
eukprot:PhF_6_TR19096/c0_g1_i1/m.28092